MMSRRAILAGLAGAVGNTGFAAGAKPVAPPPFPARVGHGRLGATAIGIRLAPEWQGMVPVPGGRAYVRVNGNLKARRLPIIFIHGGPGSAHWGWLNATALADDRAVILYDQLDTGRSDTPDDLANWVVPRFVAELEAIRNELGINRWHVLGASWGGTVALEYGGTRPPALASLILQSPLVSTRLWLRDAARLKAAMPAAVRDRLDRCDTPGALTRAQCDAATEAFYDRHVRLAATPPAIAAYANALPRRFADGVYNYMWGRAEFTATGTLKTYEGRPLLARLDARRTLFVAGEHDEAIPATIAGFASTVPGGARFAMVPDAAHSIMNDNPEYYLALLRPWLAAHDA